MIYLTADIGSTYTKLVAIDSVGQKILGTAASFTTIEEDVAIGFNRGLKLLKESVGEFKYDHFLCCSSAAGGLKMVALGLVPSLTAKAAKMAASSAGAKVIKSYSFEITAQESKEIEEISPDLILLSGGTDGGNSDVMVANAKRLAAIDGSFVTIIAGNKCAAEEVEQILREAKKESLITENVMPQFNKLNIEPAKEAIRELFIERIIEAKGLSKLSAMSNSDIIPTPLAVMQGCKLLSEGIEEIEGVGDLVAVDIGGATTDLYSIADGAPSAENIIFRGIPEPKAKRSVEGDLGMRYSLTSLVEKCTIEWIAKEAECTIEEVEQWVSDCVANPSTTPGENSTEAKIEEAIAKGAAKEAMERHCGEIEPVYTPFGQMFLINGKDLTQIPLVLGIGGVIVNSGRPHSILSGVVGDKMEFNFAKPKAPRFAIDSSYILAAMGLLSEHDPQCALNILKNHIK
ncbi:MAG: methylaspartate mutase accessory protein GlmL [Bacteroidales bacterium]